jgi:hypothetical protein
MFWLRKTSIPYSLKEQGWQEKVLAETDKQKERPFLSPKWSSRRCKQRRKITF